jgi:hypothetical protein
MPINVDNLLTQAEANDYQVSGYPDNPAEVLEVSVGLNEASLLQTFESVLRELENARTNEFMPSMTSVHLVEYMKDCLRIRVAEARDDFGHPSHPSPRVPSRGERNALQGLPIMLNIIGSIGWVKYDADICTLIPITDWSDDGKVVYRLETPRHSAEVNSWLRALAHARLTIPVQILPREKDGVQAVMLAFWQDDLLKSAQREVDCNKAFIAGFVQLSGLPERLVPLIRYMPRDRHAVLGAVVGSKEIARRRTEGGQRPRGPSQTQPAAMSPEQHVEVEAEITPTLETPVIPANES